MAGWTPMGVSLRTRMRCGRKNFGTATVSKNRSGALKVLAIGKKGVEATVDGVLGGYGHVNEPDIRCSESFLNSLLAERFPGAGGGRRLVALGTFIHSSEVLIL